VSETVIREFRHPATCFMRAQAYLAESSIGRDLDLAKRVKLICVRSEIITASIPR